MTPQPQQEYIITDDQLVKAVALTDWYNIAALCKEIRSRPAPAQWTNEEVMKEIEDAFDRGLAAAESTIDIQKHDTAIRNATLDDVLQIINDKICVEEGRIDNSLPTEKQLRSHAIVRKKILSATYQNINSLRTPTQEHP